MFGPPKQKKSDEQKSLEERGKIENLGLKNYYDPEKTIWYKDDYQARVKTDVIDDKVKDSYPYLVAFSDLTKEGYTFVHFGHGNYMFQKLPK